MGEKERKPFQLTFNGLLKVDFQGSHVTSDGGLRVNGTLSGREIPCGLRADECGAVGRHAENRAEHRQNIGEHCRASGHDIVYDHDPTGRDDRRQDGKGLQLNGGCRSLSRSDGGGPLYWTGTNSRSATVQHSLSWLQSHHRSRQPRLGQLWPRSTYRTCIPK